MTPRGGCAPLQPPRPDGAPECWIRTRYQKADANLLMLKVSRSFDRAWIDLGYTLADRQNTSDSWNDFVQGPLDPAVTDFSSLKGRAAWDERHRVVATGGADYPFDLSVSGKLVYSSSRPFTAATVDDLNGDGIFGNDRLPAEPRNGRSTGPSSTPLRWRAPWSRRPSGSLPWHSRSGSRRSA